MAIKRRRADGKVLIFRPYITVKGRRIYPKRGKVFPLWVAAPGK